MAVDPEQFKRDARSAQELAKAILDHVFEARTKYSSSMTLRERLLVDFRRKHTGMLVEALKALEENVPLGIGKKSALPHALEVIARYKREMEFSRDWQRAMGNPSFRPTDPTAQAAADLFASAGKDEQARRNLQEGAEDAMVTLSNLRSIEKLMRVLAHKIGLSLIEPGRGK
jgi:hypothetical protein